jgi:hypothetical protein
MIMSARVLAGWVKPEDLLPPPEAEGEAEAGEGNAGESGGESSSSAEG